MDERPVTTASWGFRFTRFLARMMLRSQFRRIEVDGADKVPAEGAVMIVANHFSSLVDSMGLLHASPRPASPLAKAPLFKSRVLKFFLEAVGAVPVYRPQDVAENQGRTTRANLMTFKACHDRLAAGRSIALFPEGVSQPQPRLMPVRTGAARIALDAGVPVAICPVGMVYEPPERGRRGTMLICFGEPFTVNGWEDFPSRRAAIAATTRRIEASLRDLLAEADSQADMEGLKTLRVVWDQERGVAPARTLVERHRRHRFFARVLARLEAEAPEDVALLRADTDAYVRALDLVGIPPEQLEGRYTLGRVARFLLVRVPLLLLLFPAALFAALVTWPVRHGGDVWALRSVGGREDVRALCRMMGGGLVLVFLMVGGGLLVGFLWSWWGGLAVFLGLPLLLAFHVAWRDRGRAASASMHCFVLLAGGNLRTTLQAHRRALYERLVSVGSHLGERETTGVEGR